MERDHGHGETEMSRRSETSLAMRRFTEGLWSANLSQQDRDSSEATRRRIDNLMIREMLSWGCLQKGRREIQAEVRALAKLINEEDHGHRTMRIL
jgi:hypothetical protein